MESLLGNTQTLLGTICTLAILCLFAEIKNGETSSANGNFVFQLIAAIASDVNKNLRKFVLKIKARAEVRKNEVYDRFNLKRTETESVEGILAKKCIEVGKSELYQQFLQVLTKINVVRNKILVASEINPQFDEPIQQKFIVYYNKRQEPQLIALMVFLTSILFLLVDIFQFDNSIIVPFTWFFILNIFAFSCKVWINHFSHTYTDDLRDTTRHLMVNVLCGMVGIFITTAGFSLILYLPFEVLSVILAILTQFTGVFIACSLMYRSYWSTHEYSRTIVLKHMVYFFVSALMGVLMLLAAKSYWCQPDFLLHVHFFCNPLFVRWLLYMVLILDLILIPLYGGYVHMKIDEWKTVRKIKKKVSQYDNQLDEAIEELSSVITDIIRPIPASIQAQSVSAENIKTQTEVKEEVKNDFG